MTNATYIITTSVVRVEESDICSYGISCQFDDNYICIEDISIDKSFVQQAVNDFNNYELSPNHFRDAVDDIITGAATI